MTDAIRERLRAEITPFSQQTAFFWADGDQLMTAVMDRYDLHVRSRHDKAWKRADQAAARRVAQLVSEREIRKAWLPEYRRWNKRVRREYPLDRV